MAPPNQLPTRKLGKTGRDIPALGFGLMGLSIAYGEVPSDEARLAVLDRAWELGCTNWDTSDAYGDSEVLVGKWFSLHPERRADIFLASKFALGGEMVDGQLRVTIDSTPEYAIKACDKSLERLGVDSIDLYYMHRADSKTPIERTVEAMKKLKEAGKIKAIGLSSVSSRTLRRAAAAVPIDAVQVEYNPWSLEIENETGTNLLQTCRELGVTVFAYSPLGRGVLTGRFKSSEDFAADDFRHTVPRFSAENFPKNLAVVHKFDELAKAKGCTASQMALAWLMAQGEDIVPIPGTKSIKYLEENIGAVRVKVTDEEEKEVRKLADDVVGVRVSAALASLDELKDTPELE